MHLFIYDGRILSHELFFLIDAGFVKMEEGCAGRF